jgi:hypothetical protein
MPPSKLAIFYIRGIISNSAPYGKQDTRQHSFPQKFACGAPQQHAAPKQLDEMQNGSSVAVVTN